jgi:urease accessory protein
LSGSVLVSRLTARAAVASRVDAAGRSRVTVLRSDGPLALRETPLGVYLIGTAAGPLGGDDLTLDIDVGAGACLVIRSAAGMLLLPGPHGGTSALRISARVGPGGRLDFAPQPAVAAAGCDHRTDARVDLAVGATLRWREEIVLGRHGEPSGRCAGRLDVTLAGTAAYRGELAVGSPQTDRSSAVLDGAGAAGSIVLIDAARPRPPAAVQAGLAVLPLAGPGAAVTATAPDAVMLARRLDLGEERAGY